MNRESLLNCKNPAYRFNVFSQTYKYMFIHIPKTAGNSISNALTDLPGNISVKEKYAKHVKAIEIKRQIGNERWNNFFKFAIVRNPWDLMVSSYMWWINKAHMWDVTYNDAMIIRNMKTFNEYIRSNYGRNKINEYNGNIFDWISDNGEIILDHVGKFEMINKEWKYICNKIGIKYYKLKHLNKVDRASYREYYNDESIEIVRNRFRRTIDQFNYKY